MRRTISGDTSSSNQELANQVAICECLFFNPSTVSLKRQAASHWQYEEIHTTKPFKIKKYP